jgi:hypothetical protein
MAERFATDPVVVADQAGMVAAAWSPADAPASWRLTAAQFEALRDDVELQAIAATIPPDRLPPLLFAAAATSLVLELEPQPLRDWFPSVGRPQPVLGDHFGEQYRAFCLDQRERLLELCAAHRYQMNEVGRCADLLPALPTGADGREIALIDIGTGAGLALHLDRYRYVFHDAAGGPATVGDPDSSVVLETEVRGALPLPRVAGVPRIADRVGIDVEPLNLVDAQVLAWLAACVPQEIGAVTRFHRAVDVAVANPARTVRGEALAALPDVLATIPDELLVCVVDSYVHVFFGEDELTAFRELIDRAGAERDLDWVSLDPLIPMGASATHSVVGTAVPPALIDRNRREGVFGVLGRRSYRDGQRTAELLGIAHPGAAWLEWLEPGDG